MRRVTFASAGATTIVLALNDAFNKDWFLALTVVCVGALWLVGQWRGWTWTANTGLAGLVATAALATLYGAPAIWTLPGLLAALVAWDLDRFTQRMPLEAHTNEKDALWRAHTRRLFIVLVIGALPAVFALLLRVDLGFGWTLLLALLAIVGLTRAVAAMRQGSE